MSENHTPDSSDAGNEGGVFKSAESTPQKMNAFTNSAVSDTAVERSADEGRTDEVYSGDVPVAQRDEVFLGAEPQQSTDEVFIGAQPESAEAEALDVATQSLSKMDVLVLEAQERRQQLDTAYREAEQMLERVNEISKAMVLNDQLRERLNQTVARTKGLRSGFRKMEG